MNMERIECSGPCQKTGSYWGSGRDYVRKPGIFFGTAFRAMTEFSGRLRGLAVSLKPHPR